MAEPNPDTLPVPETEVSPEIWNQLELTARLVGENFRLHVEPGEPGRGSDYDPERQTVRLDPEAVAADPDGALWEVAREAAHGSISVPLEHLADDPEALKEQTAELGYQTLHYYTEDAAAGRWVSERLPGLGAIAQRSYEHQWIDGAEPLAGAEAHAAVEQLGYVPKFVNFGQQLVRLAHRGKLSRKLDPDVKKAYKFARKDAEKTMNHIPAPGRLGSGVSSEEVLSAADDRHWRKDKYLWPVVQRLAEIDRQNEAMQQYLESIQQSADSDQQRDQESEQQSAVPGGLAELAPEMREELLDHDRPVRPEETPDPEDRPGSQEPSDAFEATDPGSSPGAGEQGEDESADGTGAGEDESTSGAEGDETEENETGGGGGPSDEQPSDDEQTGPGAQGGGEQTGQAPPDGQEPGQEQQAPSDPLEGLSKKARQALSKLFNDLPDAERERYEQQAQEQLEAVEDMIRKELETLADQSELETHEERREEQARAERTAAWQTRQAEISEQLRDQFLESLDPYERARSEVIGQVDNLYSRMLRLLKPDEMGATDYGYPTGQRLDVTRVMPAEHDFNQKHRLWIRESEPGQRDYRFFHVIDLSGSMGGEKIIETQKGFMVATEACDRLADYNSSELTVAQGMLGFNDRVMPIMDLGERLTTGTKKQIGELPSQVGGYTNTLAGTKFALDQLLEQPGQTGNFLLTFSDGEPNHDIRDALATLITDSREEREVHRLRMGLIWLGEGDDQEMLNELVEAYGYDFGLCMPAVHSPGEASVRQRDFSEALSDLLEELVEQTVPY